MFFIFKNNYTIHRLYKDNGNKSEGMNEAQKVNKFTIMNESVNWFFYISDEHKEELKIKKRRI